MHLYTDLSISFQNVLFRNASVYVSTKAIPSITMINYVVLTLQKCNITKYVKNGTAYPT